MGFRKGDRVVLREADWWVDSYPYMKNKQGVIDNIRGGLYLINFGVNDPSGRRHWWLDDRNICEAQQITMLFKRSNR